MYQRILLAVDDSRSAELAVQQAITVCKATGAEIKALFVVDDSDFPFEVNYGNSADRLRKAATRGREILAKTADRIGVAGIPCVTRLLERANYPDLIADTIVSEAEKWKADMIVMGTHGRRGFRRLVMGSVSQGVVGKTTLPVLLARSDAER